MAEIFNRAYRITEKTGFTLNRPRERQKTFSNEGNTFTSC